MGLPEIKTGEKNDKNEKDNEATAMETALEQTTFGKFHICLILLGGFTFVSSGFEAGLHAYILPFAQCDLRITTAEMGIINALYLGGGIISSFFWGAIADLKGRKGCLVLALALDGLCTVIASWSPSYVMFAMLRFVNGFLSGAPGCLANSYVGEFCTEKYRSWAICFIGFSWTLAWMLLPGIAWIIIPSGISFDFPFMYYGSWRFFVAIIGIPNLLIAFIMWYKMTETPKFLCVQGKQDEALEVLKLMYSRNTGKSPEEYPIKKIATCNQRQEGSITLSKMADQFKEVFTRAHIKQTGLATSIYFSLFFGYYGIGFWLPEMINRFEEFYSEHPEDSTTVCQLSQMKSNFTNSSFTSEPNSLEQILSDCDQRTINIGVFSSNFIIGAVCCCANILITILSNKVAARVLAVCCFCIGGISGFCLYFVSSPVQFIIASALFLGSMNSAINVHNYCTVNLFPTYVRGMGVCMGIFFGRIGAVVSNLVFGMLLDANCEIPIFFTPAIVCLGGIVSLFLPKHFKKGSQ